DEGIHQADGALAGERVEAELSVERASGPGVLIAIAVADDEEDSRGRQAIDEGVEERLGLGIDPVKVLAHQQERARLTLAQQKPAYGIERRAAALRRIEMLPLRA